jgi:AraC-like DNA-binding protein
MPLSVGSLRNTCQTVDDFFLRERIQALNFDFFEESMSVFAPALSHIWVSIEDFGMDAGALFSEADIDPALRFDTSARVSNDKFDHLLWLGYKRSRDDDFIFKLARHIQPSFMGALGLTWVTSPSLRKAFERFQRYGRAVIDGQEIDIQDNEGEMRVQLDLLSADYRDPEMRDGLTLACAVQLCRLTHGELFTPSAVHFKFGEPANVSSFYGFFHCELFFGSESNALIIPLEIADDPQSGFNPQLLQQLDLMVIEYLAGLDKIDIVGRARAEIIRQLPSGGANLASVANAMNMSQRSLARKLGDSKQTFKDLLASTRMELSEKYVLDKNLSLTEVSFLLGFSETSSFSRAYKNWTGHTPSSRRELI